MKVIIVLLLLLAGWTQHSDATNCTVYLSSQPLTLNLLCPSAICRLELLNMRGCNNGCPSCNIDDCNKVYGLCNTTQSLLVNVSSESSPQRLPSTWPAVPSNEQPINCTFVQIPNMDLMVTCRKGEYQLTFKSNTSACSRDLGINCHLDDPAATCIRVYDLCMEPQPSTCLPSSDTVSTTALNQCTNSVTIQICTEKVPTTTYLPILVYISTTMYVTVYPSHTISLNPQILETTNLLNMSSLTNTSYLSLPTHSEACTCTIQTLPLNRAISATGALVGLLIGLLVVVTTGWVCTCSRMTKLGLRSQNISNVTELNLNNNPAYKTRTILQRNLAYEVTSIRMSVPDESQIEPNQLEPVYEIIQPSSSEINTTIMRSDSEKGEDKDDNLNRDLSGIN